MNAVNRGMLEELSPQEIHDLLAANSILLVDVREPEEFATERIAGALLSPLSTFNASRLPLDSAPRIVFQCGSGKRSAMAAGRYLAAGAKRAAHLDGGIGAWKAAGLSVIAVDPSTGKPRNT
jgi:rhodanese-related sulfurtransferase